MEAREYQTRQIQFIHAPLRDHLCNRLPALTKPRPITFYTTLGSDSKRATSGAGYSNRRPCRFQTSQAPRRSCKKKQPFLGEWEMTFVTFNIACVRHGARRVLLVQLRENALNRMHQCH